MFGFSTMHYFLIVVALVVGLMVMTWRWRRLQRQNRALEEELRVLEPFNNFPKGMLPDEAPRARPSNAMPSFTPAAASPAMTPVKPPPAKPAPAKPAPNKPPMAAIDEIVESSDDEIEADGQAPVLPASSDPDAVLDKNMEPATSAEADGPATISPDDAGPPNDTADDDEADVIDAVDEPAGNDGEDAAQDAPIQTARRSRRKRKGSGA